MDYIILKKQKKEKERRKSLMQKNGNFIINFWAKQVNLFTVKNKSYMREVSP
jgi:hypothetical protein